MAVLQAKIRRKTTMPDRIDLGDYLHSHPESNRVLVTNSEKGLWSAYRPGIKGVIWENAFTPEAYNAVAYEALIQIFDQSNTTACDDSLAQIFHRSKVAHYVYSAYGGEEPGNSKAQAKWDPVSMSALLKEGWFFHSFTETQIKKLGAAAQLQDVFIKVSGIKVLQRIKSLILAYSNISPGYTNDTLEATDPIRPHIDKTDFTMSIPIVQPIWWLADDLRKQDYVRLRHEYEHPHEVQSQYNFQPLNPGSVMVYWGDRNSQIGDAPIEQEHNRWSYRWLIHKSPFPEDGMPKLSMGMAADLVR